MTEVRILALKTWRDLLAHKGQFGGIVLVVALGVMMFLTYKTVARDLEASDARAVSELHFADFSTSVERAPAGHMPVVRRIPGIASAEGRLIEEALMDVGDGTTARARVISLPDGRRPRVNDVLLEAGRWPEPGKSETLLHRKIANEIRVKPGGTVVLRLGRRRVDLRVTGIVASAEYMYAIPERGGSPSPRQFGVLFMRERDLGALVGKPGVVNDVSVVLQPGTDADRVIAEVERVLEPYGRVDTVVRADQPSNAMIHGEIERMKSMGQSMPYLFLGIAACALLIALSRLVTAQRGEIGLAKALGYSDTQILVHYLLFALIVGVIGSAAGVLIGDYFGHEMTQLYVRDLGLALVERVFYPEAAAGSAAITIVACVVAGVAPAWRSARTPPAEAMHADPNAALRGGRVPLAERLLSPVLPAAFAFRIPFRNLFRQKKRSLYTVVGVTSAVLMLVLGQSFYDSMSETSLHLQNVSERWDVTAAYREPFGADRLADVRRWKGVTDVHGVLLVPADLRAGRRVRAGMALTCVEPSADFHGFKVVSGRQPKEALEAGGLIVPKRVAEKLGVSVGDEVSVEPAGVEEPTAMRVATIVDEMVGTAVFAPISAVPRLTGSPETRFNALYVDSAPQSRSAIRARLNDIRGAVSVMTKPGMIRQWEESMAFMDSFQGMVLGFGIAMAFAVIYNTVTANVLERTREIATMRTIGESAGRIGAMIALEMLLPVLAALPLGVWLGVATGDSIMAGASSDVMQMRSVVYPTSVVTIVACIAFAMVASAIGPIRRVFRLDLAEATKMLE